MGHLDLKGLVVERTTPFKERKWAVSVAISDRTNLGKDLKDAGCMDSNAENLSKMVN